MHPELSLLPLLETIREEMEQVEQLVRGTLAGLDKPLRPALADALVGGKRLRPALVVLVGRLFACSREPFGRLAAAVEVLHTATLVHDDVVDGALTRRGQRALHAAWSPGAAVLAGDYLLARSTSLIAELDHPRLLKVFAEALCTMSAGEIRQMLPRQEGLGGREDYYARIEAKTASLCAAATQMAGMLADADEPSIAALYCFGRELGLVWQIVDDVLDFVGDEADLGKPTGSDLRQGVVTLPTLCFLERAGRDSVVTSVLNGERNAERVAAAVDTVRSSGAVDRATGEARLHAAAAQVALSGLPENGFRRLLCSLTDYVLERDR